MEYDLQRINEKGCNIIVGTVGRIYDLLEKKVISLKNLEILIMDEADKMLEVDHEVKITNILSSMPR